MSPSPIAGKFQTLPSPSLSLRWTWTSFGIGDRQVVDRLHRAVEVDIGGVVVDQHVLPADPLEHGERGLARLGDLAVDLDAEQDVARRGIVGELMDVAHEGGLVLALAVVAADRGVHDRDAHPLAEVDGEQPVGEARPWW